MKEPILSKNSTDDFKRSPLCTLSLSSKELFHSNMIGWLLENNLDFARHFLKSKDLIRVGKVAREKYNFDLLVTANKKAYVIENKVKSLPCIDQILAYKEKAKKLKIDAEYILLSLLPPDEEFKCSLKDVRIVSYEEIQEWIGYLIPGNDYLASLLGDYGLLISTLIQLKSVAAELNMTDRYAFDNEDEAILRELRLFDVAQKIRTSCLANLLDKALNDLKLPDLEELKEKTEVSLTMSMGVVSVKFGFQDASRGIPLLLGIQIQGNKYRLFVESTDGSDVQILAESLKGEGLWLNPPNETQNKILKFGRVFKYSHTSIKGINIQDLIGMVANDVSRLFQNMEALEIHLNLVKRILKPRESKDASRQKHLHQEWSEGLQQQTREAITEIPFNPDGKLHFKNSDSRYAFMNTKGMLRGDLTLTDKNDGHVSEFVDADELLNAGWAID